MECTNGETGAIQNNHDVSSTDKNGDFIVIRVPKAFIPVLAELARLSRKSVDELISSFILTGLQNICDIREDVIGMIAGSDVLIDHVRTGLQDLGREPTIIEPETHVQASDAKFDIIKVVIDLPPSLDALIDRFCSVLNRKKEDVYATFVTWCIEYVFQDEDLFLDNIDGLTNLLDEISKELTSDLVITGKHVKNEKIEKGGV